MRKLNSIASFDNLCWNPIELSALDCALALALRERMIELEQATYERELELKQELASESDSSASESLQDSLEQELEEREIYSFFERALSKLLDNASSEAMQSELDRLQEPRA